MGEVVLMLLFGAVMIGGMIWLNGRTNRLLKGNQKAIDDYMAKNNFRTTRKVNKKHAMHGMSYCHLYIDDNSKRWLLTSPYFPKVGKIRNFSDLQDYAFFDEEGFDTAGKLKQACLGMALTIGAVGIGLAGGQAAATIVGKGTGVKGLGIGAGILAGVSAGIFANKAGKLPLQFIKGSGASAAYGIILKTKDSDEDLVFDYCTIKSDGFKAADDNAISGLLSSGLKITGGLKRDGNYKHNVSTIQEMFEIFEGIIKSNK